MATHNSRPALRTYSKRKARGDQEQPAKRQRLGIADWGPLDSRLETFEQLTQPAVLANSPLTSRSHAERRTEVSRLEGLNWKDLSQQSAKLPVSAESPFTSRAEAEEFIYPIPQYSESSSPQNGSDVSCVPVEEDLQSPPSSPPSIYSSVSKLDSKSSASRLDDTTVLNPCALYLSRTKTETNTSNPKTDSSTSQPKINEGLYSNPKCFNYFLAKLDSHRPRRRLTLKPNLPKKFVMSDKKSTAPVRPQMLSQPPGNIGVATEDHLTLDISEASDSDYQRQRAALGLDRSESSFSFGGSNTVGIPILQDHQTRVPSPIGTGHPGYSHVTTTGAKYIRDADRERVAKKRVYNIEEYMEPRHQEQKAERRRRRGLEDRADATDDKSANKMRGIDMLADEMGMTPETPEQQDVRRRLMEADHCAAQTGRRHKIDASSSSSSASFAASEGATFEITEPRQSRRERLHRNEASAAGADDENDDDYGHASRLAHLATEEFAATPTILGQHARGTPTAAARYSLANPSTNTAHVAGVGMSYNLQNSGGLPGSSSTGGHSTVGVSAGGSSALGMIQTTLTVGRPTIVKCRDCGLHYNRAVPQDVQQHTQTHENFLHGIALEPDRLFEKAKVKKLAIDIDDNGESYIVMIHKDSSRYWKDLAVEVFEKQADRDLQCARTPEEYLWSTIADPNKVVSRSLSSNAQIDHVKRFTVFLQVKPVSVNGKRAVPRVIGALLAERISYAYDMMSVQVEHDESVSFPSMVAEFEQVQVHPEEPRDIFMGVNKIWVHRDHRRALIAFQMVDTARSHLIHWHVILRTQIAFSPPTEAGAAFAKYWTNPSGFHLGGDHLLFLQYSAE